MIIQLMILSIFVFIIQTLSVFAFTFLAVILNQRRVKEKSIAILILEIISIVGIVITVVEIFISIFYEEIVSSPFQSFFIYGVFRISFAFAFLVFLEYYDREKISNFTVLLFSFNIGSLVTSSMYTLFLGHYDISFANNRFYYRLFLPFFFGTSLAFASIKSYKIINQAKINSFNNTQHKQLNLLFFGVFLWFFVSNLPIGFVFNFIELNEQNLLIFIGIMSQSLVLIGVLLIGFAFHLGDQPIIPALNHVKHAFVVNDDGIPFFSHHFSGDHENDLDILLSGALSAIASLLKETLNESSLIEEIKLADMHLTMHNAENLAFILVSRRPIGFLKSSLSKFSELFINKYKNKITNFSGKINDFEEAKILLYEAFGIKNT